MFPLGRKQFARFIDPPPEPQPDVTAELATVRDSAILDLTNRLHAALRTIDSLMKAETARGTLRDPRVHNALLEVRLQLEPGSQILPLRARTPVIPGRSS